MMSNAIHTVERHVESTEIAPLEVRRQEEISLAAPLVHFEECNYSLTFRGDESKEPKQMAKRLGHGKRSEAIRDHLTANPEAMPTEIVVALAEKGIHVSTQLVSNVKHQLKVNGAPTRKRRGRPLGSKKRVARASGEPTLSDLLAAKKLADAMGGPEVVLRAIEALAQLQ